MQQQYISPLLLDKYLNETCSEDERRVVEAWYESLKSGSSETLSEQTLDEIQKEVFLKVQQHMQRSVQRPVRSLNLRWLSGIAASLILASGIYFTYKNTKYLSLSYLSTLASRQESSVTFVNNQPRIVLHSLPDGTKVWMHSNASVVYPKKFEDNKREVTFTGEGFFDVKRDTARPFFIQSGEMRIRVLGTSFNVKAIEKQHVFEVSVVSGSVQVTAPDVLAASQQVVLKPKQQAFFETDAKRLTQTAMPEQPKKEIYEPVSIFFEGTSLDKVVAMLNAKFDSNIRLMDPKMSSCELTADFEQQSLPAILEMVCTTLDASYSMSGKTILLNAPPCQ